MKLLSTKTMDILDAMANLGYCQSAKQLSKKAYQIFNGQLRPLSASFNDMNIDVALPKLEQGLVSLDSLLNKKAKAKDIMMSRNGRTTHPSCSLAFNYAGAVFPATVRL